MSFDEEVTFRIDLGHQIKSLRYCRLLGILVIIVPIAIYTLGWWPIIDFHFIGYLLCILFFFLLPVFYLHVTYYIKNRNSTFKISDDEAQYYYSDKNRQLQFKQRDIETVEQHIGIYHENNVDFASRRPVFWTNYHYVKIQLKSGEYFFLTSLMIDYKSFPMHIYTTEYRFIPYLK